MNTRQTLNEWVNAYTEDLLRWAIRKTGNTALAQDLVQDTFLVAVEKFDTFKHESSPKTWLFAILKFKIADYYRSNSPTKQAISLDDFFGENGTWLIDKVPTDWEVEENLLDNPKFLEIWQHCIDALPQNQRLCITLRYIEEVSADEICQDLELSSANYWQIVHRAKVKLRNCLTQNWFSL